ncbi:MAG: indole-3-glycerol phosphate synthase TrpC [Candidatus Aureabacteria bacterium]|nr:indole-3-glycerol phosphate synthase TrpC [Candidatus Auribacterota bacterium]
MFFSEIMAHKKKEVAAFKKSHSYAEFEKKILLNSAPHFYHALKNKGIAIIAEIKKASPSKGVISHEFNPALIARSYEKIGVHAISILTDEKFFQGNMAHLQAVREVTILPLLRKDFILDEIQILEARASGANACLLIVKALSYRRLSELVQFIHDYHMEALVEIHHEDELKMALDAGSRIVGINNRDLDTFQVSLDTSYKLLPSVPDSCLKITESGIENREQIQQLKKAGADAFLIGTRFMQTEDKENLFKELTLED